MHNKLITFAMLAPEGVTLWARWSGPEDTSTVNPMQPGADFLTRTGADFRREAPQGNQGNPYVLHSVTVEWPQSAELDPPRGVLRLGVTAGSGLATSWLMRYDEEGRLQTILEAEIGARIAHTNRANAHWSKAPAFAFDARKPLKFDTGARMGYCATTTRLRSPLLIGIHDPAKPGDGTLCAPMLPVMASETLIDVPGCDVILDFLRKTEEAALEKRPELGHWSKMYGVWTNHASVNSWEHTPRYWHGTFKLLAPGERGKGGKGKTRRKKAPAPPAPALPALPEDLARALVRACDDDPVKLVDALQGAECPPLAGLILLGRAGWKITVDDAPEA